MRLSSLVRVLQNDQAPLIIDDPPLFDLLEGSKAADAIQVIVEAAIAHAWRFSRGIDITHLRRSPLRGLRI
jgi:hypothetical protein